MPEDMKKIYDVFRLKALALAAVLIAREDSWFSYYRGSDCTPLMDVAFAGEYRSDSYTFAPDHESLQQMNHLFDEIIMENEESLRNSHQKSQRLPFKL